MNIISITGNLVKEPELKSTPSGISVCSFTLAVKRPRTSDTTDFLNVVAWRQSADYLCKYAHKGNRVGVTGVLTARNYETNSGDKRTAYEIVADNLELLESRASGQAQNNSAPTAKPQQAKKSSAFEQEMDDLIDLDDGDLPF